MTFNVFEGLLGTGIFIKVDGKWSLASLTHDPELVLSYREELAQTVEGIEEFIIEDLVDSEETINKRLSELNA